jgi:hypothetical protein
VLERSHLPAAGLELSAPTGVSLIGAQPGFGITFREAPMKLAAPFIALQVLALGW